MGVLHNTLEPGCVNTRAFERKRLLTMKDIDGAKGAPAQIKAPGASHTYLARKAMHGKQA